MIHNEYAINSGGLKRESSQRYDEENKYICLHAGKHTQTIWIKSIIFVHNLKIICSARNAQNWKQIQFNNDEENKKCSSFSDLSVFRIVRDGVDLYRMYVHEIDPFLFISRCVKNWETICRKCGLRRHLIKTKKKWGDENKREIKNHEYSKGKKYQFKMLRFITFAIRWYLSFA